jgi:hypothetical protein
MIFQIKFAFKIMEEAKELRYTLIDSIGKGSFGEVWVAV